MTGWSYPVVCETEDHGAIRRGTTPWIGPSQPQFVSSRVNFLQAGTPISLASSAYE